MKNNFYISLGVWLIVIPILGIPGVWRYRIIEFTGLVLIIHSAWPSILKRVAQKPRVKDSKIVEPIVFNPDKAKEASEEHVTQ